MQRQSRTIAACLATTVVLPVLLAAASCKDDENVTKGAYAQCINSDETFDVTIRGPKAADCGKSASMFFPGSTADRASVVSVSNTGSDVIVRFKLPTGLRPGENSMFSCDTKSDEDNDAGVTGALPTAKCSASISGQDGGPLRDGGGDPDATTPSGPRDPLGATIDFMVATNFTPRGQAFATVMAPKTPQEEDRVLKERAFFDNQAGFPTINIGECKVPPYLGVEGQPLPLSNVGPRLTINNGANPYMLMPGDGSYAGASNAVNPYGMKLSVVVSPGNADIPTTTFDQILNVPLQFTVTAPPPPGPVVTSLNAPVTVTWTPVPSSFFFLRFSQGSGHVCKADPASGTFTIPTEIMAAQRGAGMPSVDLVALNVGTTTIKVAGANRAFDTMTSLAHRIDFQVVNP